ncbi:MAG: hypothetical protein ACRD50_07970 [Candidatus Acidiferrales bacterium]
MPGLSVLIRQGEVCQCLRSKKLFYETEVEEPALPDASWQEAANAAPFWCLRTQSVLGPDGKVVRLDDCRPGRSCCESS